MEMEMNDFDSREHDQLLQQQHNLHHQNPPLYQNHDDDTDAHLHEQCYTHSKEEIEIRDNEIKRLLQENVDLKEQLRVDKCAWAVLNVLSENGDTIIVSEREIKVITQGLKELWERSEIVHLHLSTIAKDFCQKLDDFRSAMNKRETNLSLPSPTVNPSDSNIDDFIEENSQLARRLHDTERRLEEAEARNAELQETFEERLQTLSFERPSTSAAVAETRNALPLESFEERLPASNDKKGPVLEQPNFSSLSAPTTTGKNKKKKMGCCTVS